MEQFNKESFEQAIAGSGLTVVDFWADWCGPSMMLGPVIEQLGKEYEGKATFGKVNVDDEQDLAMRYNVMSIPTVIFFKDGQELTRKVGLQQPDIFIEEIEANL